MGAKRNQYSMRAVEFHLQHALEAAPLINICFAVNNTLTSAHSNSHIF